MGRDGRIACNGDGLRASKTDLFSAIYHYTWGPGGVLYDGATTYTPGLAQRQGTSASRFYHSDWVGSTRYLSDPSGLVMPSALRYDAYGQRTALAGPTYPTPYQFAGGWGYETEYSDATEPYLGLDYVDQRYYEPATGRFISPDPIGFDGGLNLYSYCDNDPVGAVDPSGLDWAQTRAWLDRHVAQPLRQVGDALDRGLNFMGTMLLGGCAPGWVGPDWRTIPEEKLHRSPTERFFLENLALAASMSGGGVGTGGAGALGEASASVPPLIARSTGEILDVTRITIAGPRNSPFGKLDYLLGRVPSAESAGKGGFFAGVMGFTDDSLHPALRLHLIDNFGSATVRGQSVVAQGPMIGPGGRTAIVRSAWRVRENGLIEFITAHPVKR